MALPEAVLTAVLLINGAPVTTSTVFKLHIKPSNMIECTKQLYRTVKYVEAIDIISIKSMTCEGTNNVENN